MKIDSPAELEAAFAEWRRKKKHAREPAPEALLVRARRAAKRHGVTEVVMATRFERARLFRSPPAGQERQAGTSRKPKGVAGSVPTFSRLELSAPSAPGPRPVAEVETGSGVKLRVFEQTPEMMALLSAVCGFGGAR